MPETPVRTTPFPTDEAIRAILERRIAMHAGVGFVVGMIEPDGCRRVVACGDPGADRQMLDGESVFEIGSITKTFTGILLADMVLRGMVDLEAPAATYLPAGRRLPARNGQEITLLHLAMHTSGLPCEPPTQKIADPLDPLAGYTDEMMLDFLDGYTLTRDIGAEYAYSNLGVSLLGYLLTCRAGKPYAELLAEHILTPLGMSMTGLILSPEMQGHLATGHDVQGDEVPCWHLDAYAPAGAIRSTAHDLLRYAEANLSPDNTPLGHAIQLAHQPHPIANTEALHGLTWGINGAIHEHFGMTGGYSSALLLNQVEHWALVILANSQDDIYDLAMHLINRAHPLAPPPLWKQREVVPMTADQLDQYTGTYIFDEHLHLRFPPNFTGRVTRGDGCLLVHDDFNWTRAIYPGGGDEFFYRLQNATITFQRDEHRAVTGMVFRAWGIEVKAKKCSPAIP